MECSLVVKELERQRAIQLLPPPPVPPPPPLEPIQDVSNDNNDADNMDIELEQATDMYLQEDESLIETEPVPEELRKAKANTLVEIDKAFTFYVEEAEWHDALKKRHEFTW